MSPEAAEPGWGLMSKKKGAESARAGRPAEERGGSRGRGGTLWEMRLLMFKGIGFWNYVGVLGEPPKRSHFLASPTYWKQSEAVSFTFSTPEAHGTLGV